MEGKSDLYLIQCVVLLQNSLITKALYSILHPTIKLPVQLWHVQQWVENYQHQYVKACIQISQVGFLDLQGCDIKVICI